MIAMVTMTVHLHSNPTKICIQLFFSYFSYFLRKNQGRRKEKNLVFKNKSSLYLRRQLLIRMVAMETIRKMIAMETMSAHLHSSTELSISVAEKRI